MTFDKQFLSEDDCKLQLVEPHNHRVNAAERAIQTFKDVFITALATTNVDFPLQLWDKLTPQVQTCLNLMRCSRIDPSKSAYETLYGQYDWNRYPRRHKRVVGLSRHRRMVPGSTDGSLPMQFVFHSRNPGILHLRVNRTIPATLPAAKPNAAPTFPCAPGGIS